MTNPENIGEGSTDKGAMDFLSNLTKSPPDTLMTGVGATYTKVATTTKKDISFGIRPFITPFPVADTGIHLCVGVKLRVEGYTPKYINTYASDYGKHRGGLMFVPLVTADYIPQILPVLLLVLPKYLENLVSQVSKAIVKEGLLLTMTQEEMVESLTATLEAELPPQLQGVTVMASSSAPLSNPKGNPNKKESK